MSVKLMTAVWDHSTERGEGLLVLLALADFASDDGIAYPAIETLMAKARCSHRGVQTILKRLRESGWLEVVPGGGRHHTNLYIIRVPSNVVAKPEASRETPQVHAETPQLVGRQMPETPQVATRNPAVSGPPNAPDPSGSVRDPSENHQEPPTTTTTAGESDDAAEAWHAVESLIGLVPPILEPRIDAAIARYGGEWVAEACTTAADANARRWDYVAAILERWSVEGYKSPKPQRRGQGQGRRNPGAGPQPAGQSYDDWVSPLHRRISELKAGGMTHDEACQQAQAERKAATA